MTEQRVPSKAELLEALRRSGDEVVRMVRALPAERLASGPTRG
jgi:hypothetical protein